MITIKNESQIEKMRKAEADREAERRAQATEVAAKLRGQKINMQVKCGAQGRLYGSITTAEIAAELEKQHGIKVDKRKIDMAEAIRSVTDVKISVWLYNGVTTPMMVHVVPMAK